MLNGVGGATIEQAKEAVSYDEFQGWLAYRAKHGPLNTASRIEWAIGQLSYLVATAAEMKKRGGGKFAISDFLPFAPKPKLTLASAMKALGVKKKNG